MFKICFSDPDWVIAAAEFETFHFDKTVVRTGELGILVLET